MKNTLLLIVVILITSCTVINIYTCEQPNEEFYHTYTITQPDTITNTNLVLKNQQIIITSDSNQYTIHGIKIK